MANTKGWQTVVPRLFATDAKALVSFIQEVFAAEGDYQQERPTELRIGDSMIMVSAAKARGNYPACLYVYVNNLETTFARALTQNAVAIEKPLLTPYGDKRAAIKDSWGNMWQIAEHTG